MPSFMKTNDRWRSRLPHWEVDGHWHFVTIRCHGSLPLPIRNKIQEIYDSLQNVEAHSDEFSKLQRQYFMTAEKYLDRGEGFAPFKDAVACEACLEAFSFLDSEGWHSGEVVLMPNHIHFLSIRVRDGLPLREALSRFKGRSARGINRRLGRSGRIWQQDWFDRWMRDEAELARTVRYIRNNPVAAGLARDWKSYRWRISRLNP